MSLIRKADELKIQNKIKALIYGQAGMGKSQPLNSLVLTPSGFVQIGSLSVGDTIIGIDGNHQKVEGVFPQGTRPVYRINTNDGCVAHSDIEHIWNVRHGSGNSRKKGFVNYTLSEIIDKGVVCPQTPREKKTGRKASLRFELPVAGPVNFSEKKFIIDPYVLGVLIGDGSLTENVAAFSTPDIDSDIVEKVKLQIEDGFAVERHDHPTCPKYHIVMRDHKKGQGYMNKIKALALNVLSSDKFIPKEYLLGSIGQRVELLRGLMDTDGSSLRNRVYFSTSSKVLAFDVKELVMSLGGISKIHTYKREGKGIEYRVSIKLNISPFSLKRKTSQWSESNISRYIENVERIEDAECVCIKVSNEDQLYITDDFIVTHNTTFAISSPKPLLFDFDGGVHRVNFQHLKNVDTVQITSYQDFLDVLTNESLDPYDTFVIDTGGKLLDYMGEYIISKKPNMGRGNGILTLQGYGERKGMFSALIKKISIMDKHIVFVAHRQTTTEGDETRYVPMFGGSNYDSLVTELDLVGYMEANGKQRTITFDPTSRNDGKNTCNLPAVIKIPTIIDENGDPTAENNYMEKFVIQPYYSRLEQRKAAGQEYNVLMEELENQILAITDDRSANDFVSRIDAFDHIGNSKMAAGKLLSERAKQLKLTFNKAIGKYEAATPSQKSVAATANNSFNSLL